MHVAGVGIWFVEPGGSDASRNIHDGLCSGWAYDGSLYPDLSGQDVAGTAVGSVGPINTWRPPAHTKPRSLVWVFNSTGTRMMLGGR